LIFVRFVLEIDRAQRSANGVAMTRDSWGFIIDIESPLSARGADVRVGTAMRNNVIASLYCFLRVKD
jgi:hypothetical protein